MHCKACDQEYTERPLWLDNFAEGLCPDCAEVSFEALSYAMEPSSKLPSEPRMRRGDQRRAKEGVTKPL